MKRNRFTVEQIIRKHREAEVRLFQGKSVKLVSREPANPLSLEKCVWRDAVFFERSECRFKGRTRLEEMDKVVNLVEHKAFSNNAGLQILLSGLLEMEAYLGIKLASAFEIGFRKSEVVLRLLKPFLNDQGISHKGFSPLSAHLL